jgi:hypothetical protein
MLVGVRRMWSKLVCWLLGHKWKTVYFTGWDFAFDSSETTWRMDVCKRCLNQKDLNIVKKIHDYELIRKDSLTSYFSLP